MNQSAGYARVQSPFGPIDGSYAAVAAFQGKCGIKNPPDERNEVTRE